MSEKVARSAAKIKYITQLPHIVDPDAVQRAVHVNGAGELRVCGYGTRPAHAQRLIETKDKQKPIRTKAVSIKLKWRLLRLLRSEERQKNKTNCGGSSQGFVVLWCL